MAAHPDDEILGCGGSLLYYKSKGYKIRVIFMSDGESSRNLKNKRKEKQLITIRKNQAKLVSKNQNLLIQSSLIIQIIKWIQFLY